MIVLNLFYIIKDCTNVSIMGYQTWEKRSIDGYDFFHNKDKCSDVDPHWLYADPDPQNLINADPDPGRI